MIFVDGEPFPPSLHGTGAEDYFNTAWCPTQEYNAPYHGLVLPGEQNWWGKVSMYRFPRRAPRTGTRASRTRRSRGSRPSPSASRSPTSRPRRQPSSAVDTPSAAK